MNLNDLIDEIEINQKKDSQMSLSNFNNTN